MGRICASFATGVLVIYNAVTGMAAHPWRPDYKGVIASVAISLLVILQPSSSCGNAAHPWTDCKTAPEEIDQ